MKHSLSWIVLLGGVLVVTVPVGAQQSGKMHDGSRMGAGMIGNKGMMGAEG